MTNSMRIAFAMINCNRRDGSARAVNEVAERLARRGHEVHLFARKVEDLDLSQIQWHRVPGPSWPEIADFASYHHLANRMIDAAKFDIVHSVGPNTQRANVVTIQNIQPAKIPILRQHGSGERISPLRRLTRNLYLRATAAAEKSLYTRSHPPLFLPVSRGVAAELRHHYAIGDAPLQIIPNAADTELFQPLSSLERGEWRAAHGFSESDGLALFSGGEWARKGLDLAIKAAAISSNWHLLVAGDDPDRERYVRMVRTLAITDRVHFLGFRSDIATVMGAADLFLFPSHYEAFSLATIEAAACGLPIVAAKINGTEDFIQPGQNGEFIPHEPHAIAACVDALFAHPKEIRRMGAVARQLVQDEYTWDRVTTMTEEAYRSVIS